MNDLREVYFNAYCPTCKHWKKEEADSPCNDCLEIPGRVDSHVPEYYNKEKE